MRVMAEQFEGIKGRVAGGRRRPFTWGHVVAPLAVVAVVAAALVTSPVRAPWTAPPQLTAAGEQTHYLPLDAQQFYDTLLSEEPGLPAQDVRLISSIISSRAGNTVAIDHWEDGYDADPVDSPSSTTEVSTMGEGEVQVLDNVIVLANIGDITPGGSGQPYYDGRDKIVSTSPTVVTTGGWGNSTGSVHAGASAVPEVSRYGYAFESPVGEDTPFDGTADGDDDSPWEYTGLIVQAAQDGTTVNITGEASVSLDEGDVHLVDGGINVGDDITADKPVAVYLATGDVGAGFEGRLYELTPTERWTDTYFSPVTSTNNSARVTRAFLYNPGSSAITVTVTRSNATSTTVTVPANGQASYLFPSDVGAKFESSGNPFYALQVITTPETGNDSSSSWNWGFSLIPEAYLTPMVVLGYATGSSNLTENDSAVWVAPAAATTIYVDRDGDTSTGALTDANGNKYDFSCAMDALRPRVIADDGTTTCHVPSAFTNAKGSGDADMTGARIYTLDGTALAAAWGQVPGLNASNPAIDMGTTVLPFPTVDLTKTSEIIDDDGDGLADPGETIRYTISATNAGITPVDNLLLTDEVPEHTSYVPGTTIHNGNPIADDGSGTPFPLDGAGVTLPPALNVGQTRTVTFDVAVDDPLEPTVTEIVNEATLATSYGTYTAVDVQPVDPPAPEISLAKTVYAGHDGGASCQGADLVAATAGAPVTYCFAVTNEGNITLAPVTLEDLDLGIDETDVTDVIGDLNTLGHGETAIVYYETTVAGDLLNTASVTGTAIDGNGDPVPTLDPVTATDTAEVDEIAPALSVAKTVYRGHDGGALCAGAETAIGVNGDPVTYCFEVTNTGDTTLAPVTVSDPALGIDQTDMGVVSGDLAQIDPGDTTVLYYEATLDGDLTNTATATGVPSDPNGDPLPGVDPVDDDDTADADEVHPAVSVAKTVYQGHDAGASCQGNNLVNALNGDDLTWCFVVTNDGDTELAPITLDDGDLGIDETDMTLISGSLASLAPGDSVALYYQGAAAGDLPNTVTATGVPADGSSDPLPGLTPVTDDDDAAVDTVGPAVTIQKTVYRGHDAGAGCDGVENLPARNGEDVTWCFTVTNSGDTDLSPVTLADGDLGIDESDLTVLSGDLADLPAGETAVLYLEGTVDGDLHNTAAVTGTPVDTNGDPLVGIDDVTDDDDATIDEVAPTVSVAKTVYRGHDSGAGCPGGELVNAANGGAVTWCFTISNDGDTRLAPVELTDLDLGIAELDLTVLSGDLAGIDPGQSVVAYYEGTVAGDLLNTATVSGTPTDPGGTPLPGIDPVTDDDTAEVNEVGPLVEVAKTVYAGHDGGTNCPGNELQRGANGAAVTYCFTVTNTGDTDLASVTLDDGDLGIDETDMDLISGDLALIAPGDSAVLAYETTLDGDLVNDVTVTATGVDDQGDPFDGIDPVTDDDTAEVQEVTPSIAITKGIYAGHSAGSGCPGAGGLTAVDGDPVTYCFTVVNNGGATLAPVTVVDPQLNIDQTDMEVLSGDLASMAPGATTVLYYETDVANDLVNTATATGTPRDGDDPLPGSGDVSDDDQVTLDEVAPAVSVAKTVYQGHDAGASCQGGNLVRDANGADVTWCFAISNDGDTNLAPVTLADAALTIDQTDLVPLSGGDLADLAPGDTAILYYEGSVTGSFTNTAVVTGTPADPGGDAYPGLEDVTAQDDAAIEQIAPSVSVAKTVYKGHDGGTTCPGDELVQGATGAEVTYCFVVTNDGDTTLEDVTVDDVALGNLSGADLSGDTAALASMAPGDSAVLFYETTIDGDLINTAEVTGTPVDDQGDPFSGIEPVTDSDTAEVDDVSPSVAIDKSVYAGHDSGAGCAGAGNLALRNGDAVTYCFVITNDGEASLDPVTFSDPLLGLTEANVSVRSGSFGDPLAPGDSIVAYHEDNVDGDLTNVATVTGTPVDDGGDPLPGSDPVTDEDVATVDEVDPSISVAKTVYRGHDDGAGCAGGERAFGLDGDPLTWCFVVTNEGDTPLAPVAFADGDLGIDEADLTVVGAGDLASLDPQESVTLYYEGTVTRDLENTATVTGTPVDGNGDPLPEVDDVTDDDTAEVVEVAPAVSVAKTVYQGHTDGAGCAGGESVPGLDGDPVTYCFEVTNTGDTTLTPVTLDDQTLGIAGGAMEVLSGSLDSLGIGQSAVLYYETTMTEDLTNTVTATGTPSDGQGDPLPGIDEVTDTDTALVEEVAPAVSIEKTVARGHDAGANCTGTDVLAGLAGEDVTWCFVVTNEGDTTLVDATFADADLGIDESDLTVVGGGSLASLAPNESVTLYYDGVIAGDLPNTADVSATPADDQGDPLPGVSDVTDSDGAQVFEVAPSVSIVKTVYRGHDAGAGCEGSNLVAGENGDAVTYCFVVTNDGDTRLTPVDFSDPALSLVDASALDGDVAALDSMGPGDTVTLYYETTVNGDLTNTATVTGSPADGNGDPLPGVEDVTDSDTAMVDGVGPAVHVAKTVYGGHDNGTGCEGDELLTALVGDDATWCFVVTNNGDTILADVTVADDDLGITQADLSGDTAALASMAPGDVAVLWLEGTVTDDLVNTATVTGTPVDDQGDPLGVDDPTDSDTAEVDAIEPSVSVTKTVYRDHDGGAGCPGADSVTGVAGRDLTWCFLVTNDGDTRLAPVLLDDADLGVDQGTLSVASGDLSAMDPGDTAVLYYEGTLDGDLDNTATVTGTPVDDTDTPLPRTQDVTDDDTASVDEIAPSFTLLTEVHDPLSGDWYDADADGSTPGSNDGRPATLRAGDTASFRFTVTNTGDVGIPDVAVDAPQCDEAPVVVSGDSINSGVLDVGEVWVLSCTVSDLTGGLTLDAVATGGSPDGPAAGSGEHEVADVQVAAVTVEKLVLDPDTGDFVDVATIETGADATYRIVVTNTGEVPLAGITVADELGPDCERTFTDTLDPGDSFAPYTCAVSGVDEGFVNVAVATGTPVDDTDTPVGVEVTDEDTATVETESSPVTDLAITKDLIEIDNTDLVATWQVTVTNVGDTAATEPIIVTDELDDGLQYRDASGDGWICDFVDPTLTCVTDTDLAVGGSTSVTVETYVVGAPGDTVTNVARVDGIDDTDDDNNTDDAAVEVDETGGLEPVIPGDLPRTGADIAGLVLAAGLLIVTGVRLRRWSKKLS